jgi:DNA helicase-2/ATP-dependent DNA helicase PcrA
MPKLRILARTRTLLSQVERGLQRNRIEYAVHGIKSFKERREIRDFVAFWSWYRNPRDLDSLKRACKAYRFGVGPATIDKNADSLTDEVAIFGSNPGPKNISHIKAMYRHIHQQRTFYDQVLTFLFFGSPIQDLSKPENSHVLSLLLEEDTRDDENGESKERLDSLRYLLESIKDENMDLDQFLDDYALNPDKDDKPEAEIVLQTIHASKGLESDYVIVVGFSDGLLPHASASYDEAQYQEERRLAFVAISRAKKGVYLLHSKMRFHFGTMDYFEPSSFLKGLNI